MTTAGERKEQLFFSVCLCLNSFRNFLEASQNIFLTFHWPNLVGHLPISQSLLVRDYHHLTYAEHPPLKLELVSFSETEDFVEF